MEILETWAIAAGVVKWGSHLGKPDSSTKANGGTEDTAEWLHDYLVSQSPGSLTPGKQTNKQTELKVAIGVGFFEFGENLKCTVLGTGGKSSS